MYAFPGPFLDEKESVITASGFFACRLSFLRMAINKPVQLFANLGYLVKEYTEAKQGHKDHAAELHNIVDEG
jgi:hypothetical protein